MAEWFDPAWTEAEIGDPSWLTGDIPASTSGGWSPSISGNWASDFADNWFDPAWLSPSTPVPMPEMNPFIEEVPWMGGRNVEASLPNPLEGVQTWPGLIPLLLGVRPEPFDPANPPAFDIVGGLGKLVPTGIAARSLVENLPSSINRAFQSGRDIGLEFGQTLPNTSAQFNPAQSKITISGLHTYPLTREDVSGLVGHEGLHAWLSRLPEEARTAVKGRTIESLGRSNINTLAPALVQSGYITQRDIIEELIVRLLTERISRNPNISGGLGDLVERRFLNPYK